MTTEDVSARFVDLDGWPTRDAVEAMFEGQLAAVAAVRPALGAPSLRPPTRRRRAEAGRPARLCRRRNLRPGSGCRTAPSCRPPSTGRSTSWSSPWRAARARSSRAPRARRMMPPPRSAPSTRPASARPTSSWASPPRAPRPTRWRPWRGAAERGAVTIGIANNPDAPLLAAARHKILTERAPRWWRARPHEGGHRAKGRAQPPVDSDHDPPRRVYSGMMVHMHASNAKLHRRARDMVIRITGCDHATAVDALTRCAWEVKTAVLVVHGLTPRRRRGARPAGREAPRGAGRGRAGRACLLLNPSAFRWMRRARRRSTSSSPRTFGR